MTAPEDDWRTALRAFPGARISVVELGLACCGIVLREGRRDRANGAAGDDGSPPGGPGVPSSATDPAVSGLPASSPDPTVPTVSVLLVAGTVTTKLVPRVQAAYEALPEPRAVIAFGACACTGGPYWDSYSVLPGLHEVIPVDVRVPGCPPGAREVAKALQAVLDGN